MGLVHYTTRLGFCKEKNVIDNTIDKYDDVFKENAEDFIINKGSYADSLKGINQFDIKNFCEIQDANFSEELANHIQEQNNLDDDLKWEIADELCFYLYDIDHTNGDTFIDNFYSKQAEDIYEIVDGYVKIS